LGLASGGGPCCPGLGPMIPTMLSKSLRCCWVAAAAAPVRDRGSRDQLAAPVAAAVLRRRR
jgi:hypothetical protein